MYTSLHGGALGVDLDFETAVTLAVEFGFGGVEPDMRYLRSLPEAELGKVAQQLADQGLRWGSAGAPVDVRAPAPVFAEKLAALAPHAEILRAAGVERAGTWIRPMSDAVTYRRNFTRHVERLAMVDEVLAAAGLRFGVEYVGPKTLWSTERFPFVHTLAETRELLAAVGSPNLGVVLDTFHWYVAGETPDDLRTLTADQIVAVDLNDALPGLERDQQMDLDRALPGTTGVIDLTGFLGALNDLSYDGPAKVEPFSQELKGRPDREVVEATAQSLHAVLG